jgi:hypothetical protein
VGVDGAGKDYVFWQGTDGRLWTMAGTNGHWSRPSPLGSGTLGSAPAVAVHPNGEQDVFWSGTDGRLWEMWHTNRWNGPIPLAGGRLSSPPAAGTDASGKP